MLVFVLRTVTPLQEGGACVTVDRVGWLFLYGSPVTNWGFVQGVSFHLLEGSWDMFQHPATLLRDKTVVDKLETDYHPSHDHRMCPPTRSFKK